MGLLSGMNLLGLGDLENVDLYEKKQKNEQIENEKRKPVEIREEDLLFDKTYTCPICEGDFKNRTVRASKAHFLGTDMDLRPKYEGIDLLKYDTVVCPVCGYAALSRYFKYMTNAQAKLIEAGICMHFRGRQQDGAVYTYDQALERYKLVLANAIVKRAKASEKAYICLKSAWILRGMGETVDMQEQSALFKKASLEKQEKEYLENALDGFLAARQTESFPMCGMDVPTVDYLIAVLAMEMEKYDISLKILSSLLASRQVNARTKDKARDAKEMLMKKIKESTKENSNE